MSCHITLYDCRLHMKHPELFIGVRVCHPSTLRWTERVVLCFFCPAGGGRVPWSKVWRCRGPWSIMGFPDYHEMIITFLNITVSSTKQNILDQFFFGTFWVFIPWWLRFRDGPAWLWNNMPGCWPGRSRCGTPGLGGQPDVYFMVFHAISWYFSRRVTYPLWITREQSKILYKWRIWRFLAGKIVERNGGILEGSYGNHHVYTYNK